MPRDGRGFSMRYQSPLYRHESHRVATKVAEMGALSVKPACVFAFSFVHSFILFLNLLIY